MIEIVDVDNIVITPQTVKIIDKICRHLYGDNDITSKMARMIGRSTDIHASKEFLESLPTSDLLYLIEQLLVDPDFDSMKYSNWNYFGVYVREWPDQLISALKLKGITYDYDKSEFLFNNEIINRRAIVRSTEKYLPVFFEDPLYNELVDEINKSVTFDLPNAAYVLSRKLVENLIIDVLRKKFSNSKEGVNLYYDTARRRFKDFSILINNLNDNKSQYLSEEKKIETIVALSERFKKNANSSAHSIFSLAKIEELDRYKVPDLVKSLQSLLIRV